MSGILAFDIGGTKIASGVVQLPSDDSGRPKITLQDEIPTRPSEGGDKVRERLIRFAASQLESAKLDGLEIEGIGIAAAGVPDSTTGEIISATDILPGWRGQQLYAAFAEITDLPVYMVGDVIAHGIGEAHYGAGRGSRKLLSIGVGTGIGGAIIIDGDPYLGAHGVAGHAGHMTSPLGQGFLCSCGSTEGHIEPVASGQGLANLYNRRAGRQLVSSGAQVAQLAQEGDKLATSTLSDSAEALGACIGGMANLIDPDGIVISGSVTKAGPVWWNALQKGFSHSALPLLSRILLVDGNLGGQAPLIGAAVAAHRHIAHQ